MTGAADATSPPFTVRLRSVADHVIERRWPLTLLFVGLLVALWQLAGTLGRLPTYVFSPAEIVRSVVDTARDGVLHPMIASSMRRLAWGFVLGTASGVLLGLVAGVILLVEDIVDPLVSLTYPLPKIALFPAIAVWLGFSDQARILIIALACFYPAFVNSLSGTRAIDPIFLWVSRNVGASRLRTFWSVVIPASLPRVLIGMRISLALSFVLLFATEAIASREGLGFLIFDGYLSARRDLMYTGIVTLAALGFVADRLMVAIGRRVTRGHSIEAIGRG